jgi:hypothetical protein
MKRQKYASLAFGLGGILLIGLGLYFMFLRPVLLPKDPRYMGTSLAEIQQTFPGLLLWLRRVFWVTLAPGASAGVGGFMLASGLLTTYIALTAFQQPERGARVLVSLANLVSIGWMAIVNFMIDSDFKWLLLAFNLPWILAFFLSWETVDKSKATTSNSADEKKFVT